MLKRNFTILAILAIFLVTMALRVPFLHQDGLDLDTDYWMRWTQSIEKVGLIDFYRGGEHPDYPPVYIYWLDFTTIAHKAITGSNIVEKDLTFNILTRLPSLLFDAAIGIFLFLILKKKYGEEKAFGIGILYAVLLPFIYDGAVWGQVDSIHTFFVLLTLWLAYKRKFVLCWIFYGLAICVKFQSIMIFIPLLIYTYLYWQGVKGIFKAGVIAIITSLVVSFPFLIAGRIFDVINVYISYVQAGTISANCLNFWWPFNFVWNYIKPTISTGTANLITNFLKIISLSSFVLTVFISVKLLMKDRKYLYLASAFSVITFVMFNLSMHDRYLYPFFAIFMMFLISVNKKFKGIFVFFLITYTYNLVMTAKYSLPKELFSPPITITIAILNVIVYFIFLKLVLNEINNSSSNLQRSRKYSIADS